LHCLLVLVLVLRLLHLLLLGMQHANACLPTILVRWCRRALGVRRQPHPAALLCILLRPPLSHAGRQRQRLDANARAGVVRVPVRLDAHPQIVVIRRRPEVPAAAALHNAVALQWLARAIDWHQHRWNRKGPGCLKLLLLLLLLLLLGVRRDRGLSSERQRVIWSRLRHVVQGKLLRNRRPRLLHRPCKGLWRLAELVSSWSSLLLLLLKLPLEHLLLLVRYGQVHKVVVHRYNASGQPVRLHLHPKLKIREPRHRGDGELVADVHALRDID
jgi:hypothetical protein